MEGSFKISFDYCYLWNFRGRILGFSSSTCECFLFWGCVLEGVYIYFPWIYTLCHSSPHIYNMLTKMPVLAPSKLAYLARYV